MKKVVLALFLVSALIIAGCTQNTAAVSGIEEAVVYKSPTCGCCVGWIPHLEGEGFNVKTIMTQNLNPVKLEHNIPRSMWSCHTAIIGDYFVEGHIPMEAINKLLTENPDIDGIALPGMPAGSPGMPGIKQGTWTIYAIKDGEISTFMEV